jgi:phosphoribosylanthranilate isomerase
LIFEAADKVLSLHTPTTEDAMEMEEHEGMENKIKNTWSQLSDEVVQLYGKDKDAFFDTLHKKYGISKDEAMKKLEDSESSGMRH